jgi:hypothetical protein
VPRKLWITAELEKFSRNEQQAIFDQAIITDLDDVPPAFLAKVRAEGERLIAARESQRSD